MILLLCTSKSFTLSLTITVKCMWQSKVGVPKTLCMVIMVKHTILRLRIFSIHFTNSSSINPCLSLSLVRHTEGPSRDSWYSIWLRVVFGISSFFSEGIRVTSTMRIPSVSIERPTRFPKLRIRERDRTDWDPFDSSEGNEMKGTDIYPYYYEHGSIKGPRTTTNSVSRKLEENTFPWLVVDDNMSQ